IFYRPLEKDDLRRVVRRMIDELRARLAGRGISLDVASEAREALVAAGYEPDLGARPLRRLLPRLVEAPLADMILAGDLDEGSTALVSVESGAVTVDAVGPAQAAG